MPEISRFYGVVITMYYGNPQRHNVPHFHARYGEYQASFTIEPPSWLAGTMPRKQMQIILAWAELNSEALLANWQRVLDELPLEELPLEKVEGLR